MVIVIALIAFAFFGGKERAGARAGDVTTERVRRVCRRLSGAAEG